MVPPEFEVHLVDEIVEDIDFNEEPDLVGITLMTPMALRVYEIAGRFRQRGSKVVLGGIHSTAVPEEAAQHADSVVVGEAEGNWPWLLRDFAEGSPQLRNELRHAHVRSENSSRRPQSSLLDSRREDLTRAREYL
jgi:radical SAM superfamily enzyme YgiQ (UPF0313 family)